MAALIGRVYQVIGRELEPTAMRFDTDVGYAYQANQFSSAVLETPRVIGGGLHSPDEFAKVKNFAPRL
ncbi:MAG TPA: hypothetical protein VKB53_08245 [Gammaproteobacteria bacterium]|nr:hypothetical protein [Gammaproteobacteria bacterium]HKH20858.1 hypothetical protein [Gammaproteobacteria bacterium]